MFILDLFYFLFQKKKKLDDASYETKDEVEALEYYEMMKGGRRQGDDDDDDDDEDE